MERALISKRGMARSRSNKYSGSDSTKKPAPGTRQRIWVGHMLETANQFEVITEQIQTIEESKKLRFYILYNISSLIQYVVNQSLNNL